VGGVREVELLDQLPPPAPRVLAAEPIQAADHREVLHSAQVLVHGHRLAGEPDTGPHPVRLAEHVVPSDEGGSAVRSQQGGEDPERGRLASAVRPEQRQDVAFLDREIDSLQRLGFAVGLGDCVCFDDWHGDLAPLSHLIDFDGLSL
jgi:hypothetical protein